VSDRAPAYGRWPLVVLDSAIFISFAFGFTKPKTSRDWRALGAFGAFGAFVVALLGGFMLLGAAWDVLYRAQREGRLATTGPYARARHAQYVALVMILLGFLLQWPALPTLVMFPILVVMYARLARREEREERAVFGAEYDQYAARVPALFPRGRVARHVPPGAPSHARHL